MKKIIFSITLVVLSVIIGIAQENNISWREMMLSPNYSFFEVQEVFYKELDGRPYKSIKGYKQFKRWEAQMELKVDKNGHYDNLKTIKEYQQFKKESTVSSARNTNTWTSLGPFAPVQGNGVGRVNIVAFHPTDNNVLWAGTPSGGLWKSINGGTTWSTNSDNFPNLGISDIAIHPTNPNIMYIGTGDRDGLHTYSYGLLKSFDGGITWGLTALPIGTQNLIHRVLINPNNPDILLVATSRGLYGSTNAGSTWALINPNFFRHIEFNPGNPNIVYATTYATAGGSRFYRSTNGGGSFSQSFFPFPSFGTTRLRMAIGVTPANSNIVYATASKVGNMNGFEGLYKSTNSGFSFTKVNTTSYPADLFTQSCYDWTLAVSPTDPNELYLGDVALLRSNDGGINWSHADGGLNPVVHVDHHFAGFQPNTSNLFIGCDGGVYKTANGGNNWTNLSNGLAITQYYRLAGTPQDATLLLGGAQDNGTHFGTSESWFTVTGGDGMECIIDPTDLNDMFTSSQNGNIIKIINVTTAPFPIASINEDSTNESGAWTTPYVMDPNNSNILYAGYESIWKSTDKGYSWVNKSNVLSSNNFRVIQVAPSNSNVIYASDSYQVEGEYHSKVWKSTDGGDTWAVILLSSHGTITALAIHPTNPNELWATRAADVFHVNGTTITNVRGNLPNIQIRTMVYQANSSDGLYIGTDFGVYYKDNTLADWQLFSTSLPNVQVNELEIHYPSGKIRAATFGRGMWEANLYSNPSVCNVPSSPTESNISQTTTTITWNTATGATAYQGQYRIQGSTTWLPINNITSNSHTLSNLTAATTYEWQVRTQCLNNIYSNWVSANFTTSAQVTCNIPTDLNTTNITSSSATLNWNSISGATNYNLRYKPTTATNWQLVPELTNTTSTISNLTPNTAYQWEIQANCANKLSSWVTSNFSTTSNSGSCPTLPDLIVDQINVITATTQRLEFEFTIKNIGGIAANMTGDINNSTDNVKYHSVLSTDVTYDNSDITVQIPSDFVSGNFGVSIPAQGTAMGAFSNNGVFSINTHPYLIIIIDTENDLEECIESNNTTSILLSGGTTMDNLSLNDTPILNDTYCANINITSVGTINNNGNVIMKAGTSIQLLPGFHTYHGADLHAYIDACSTSFVPEDTSIKQTNKQLVSTTKLESISPEFQLKVIPNPVQRNASIHFYLPFEKFAAINLLNLNGQLITQQKIQGTKGWNSTQLDASQLPAGVYFIALQTNTNRLIKKIIVSR